MFEEIYTHFDAGTNNEICTIRVTTKQLRHPEPAEVFKNEVLEVLEKTHPRGLLIDFAHVNFMGSTMFAAMLSIRMETERRGILYAISALHPDVELVSNIVGIPRLIATYDDAHAARDALTKALHP